MGCISIQVCTRREETDRVVLVSVSGVVPGLGIDEDRAGYLEEVEGASISLRV